MPQQTIGNLAMTCVCVGCGTEVKDKEGRPVEKLYDQVNTCSGRNVNDIYHLKWTKYLHSLLFHDRHCWQTQTYWSCWSVRSVDKCATDILRFHVMPRLLWRKRYKWLPSRFVALWCCLTLLSKASLPSGMFSSTVAMQELCSGKDIFSFNFNSGACH